MLTIVLVGLLQLVVIVTLALAGPEEDPHAAPIRVVAPAVVGAFVVERANSLQGRPVEAEALSTPAEARDSVRGGRSVAAIVVDLRQETDRVYVASANGTRLNQMVLAQITAIESSYGRSIAVTDLVPVRSGDADHWHAYVLAGTCVVVGLGVAVLITWRRGPHAETLTGGSWRLAASAAAAVVVGGVLAVLAAAYYDTGIAAWWLVMALTILAGATTTLALESLLGVPGIGVATTVLVLSAAPMVTLAHPLLLPEPWATLTQWLPHGAGRDAATSIAYFGGGQIVRPVLVLVVWSVISVVTTAVARRERARHLAVNP
ncbi:hypothetical protein C6I20_16125 [Aeromicrobium sp. A1-2]|nr:hypothetical protein C6I20_16125 [Aeromicrobium sp. A1-2]